MTGSFGGSSDNPPPGNQPNFGQNWGGMPQWQPPTRREDQPAGEPVVKPKRIDIQRRFVALVVDVVVSYFSGIVVSFIPIVNAFLPVYATMIIYLLCRDFLFEGRGVGKNIMGIQVVDITTGAPCSLIQSVQRNVILLAPYIVLQAVEIVLRFIPVAWLNKAVMDLINLVGMVYVAIVIPMEAYRAYSREDGMRYGDEIAGTTLIDAPMSFANVLPRQG